ncbi:hypothetical protein [Microbulbifer aestuariivivens]|uniref:hypothetical protein n=1 Tax=Microbulbifer aestuariivivens TaxID=1908308 RepID=UPI0031F12E58
MHRNTRQAASVRPGTLKSTMSGAHNTKEKAQGKAQGKAQEKAKEKAKRAARRSKQGKKKAGFRRKSKQLRGGDGRAALSYLAEPEQA